MILPEDSSFEQIPFDIKEMIVYSSEYPSTSKGLLPDEVESTVSATNGELNLNTETKHRIDLEDNYPNTSKELFHDEIEISQRKESGDMNVTRKQQDSEGREGEDIVKNADESSDQNNFINGLSQILRLLQLGKKSLGNLSVQSPKPLGEASVPSRDDQPEQDRVDRGEEDQRINHLLGQGDNEILENIWRHFSQNIVVNVNMSPYIRIMMLILSLNSLLLIKIFAWDPFVSFFFES